MKRLPEFIYEDLAPTRDYLQEVTLVLSSLQRAFLPKHPRDWQYGLEVSMRGISTQPFMVAGKEVRASLDLVKRKVRLEGSAWDLSEYAAPEILNNIRVWLANSGATAVLDEPKFAEGAPRFDTLQADAYALALWQLDEQFRSFKAELTEGVTAPILLYPHHFDLSLVWFPADDDRQLSIGFSTGDNTIHEPYIYITAYPEAAGFNAQVLVPEAHWQQGGFSGAILPYAALQASSAPNTLFHDFASKTFATGRELLD